MALLVLVGGARSGKSGLAVRLAGGHGIPVVFIATAEARDDDEMAERIELHRAERPLAWATVEEPLRLLAALEAAPAESCVVIDCLSLWVANLLERGEDAEEAAAVAATVAADRSAPTIAVTNEVGMGVVPATPLGRVYRDVLGRVNASWAEAADESYFVVAGKALRLSDVCDARAAAQRAFDLKTKPRGSLGVLEEIAVRIAALEGVAIPPTREAAIVVAAADHGVAAEGVSAYPQEVTPQMVANFAAGGAAINVLAREAGARLVVVDAGVAVPCEQPEVRALRFGAGTASITRGPAMERAVAQAALEAGRALAAELVRDGIRLIAIGEMGIGNTTSASALAAALLPAEAAVVCGRGTGLDDAGLARKVAAVDRALSVNNVDPGDGIGVLAALGGFEIALLTGVILGCYAERVPVVLDGFITGAAALVAMRVEPTSVDAMIASHRSPEPGHALILDALGLEPLVDLRMRLGEGSGAALALPIIASSLALLNDMASFDDAGVTDAGR